MSATLVLLRYLSREIYSAVLSALLILLLVLISNQVLHHLNDAAAGQITPFSLVKLLVVQAPLLIGFLLPVAFFIALLLVLGRWSASRELTVWFASGLSRWQLMIKAGWLTLMVTALVAVTMFWVEPYMNWYRKNIIAVAQTNSAVAGVLPGRFQKLGKTGWVIYTEDVDHGQDQLWHVFAAQLPDFQSTADRDSTIVTAHGASQVERYNQPYLEFRDGHKYQLRPGQSHIKSEHYKRFGLKLPGYQSNVVHAPEFLSMSRLWQEMGSNHGAAAEFQWRLAMPIATIVLGLLAVFLVQPRPAASRFSLLLPGLVIYFPYIQMLIISRAWLKKGNISHTMGLWWVHGIMALVLLAMAARYFGFWGYWRHWRSKQFSRSSGEAVS